MAAGGLTMTGTSIVRKLRTTYSPELALRICEAIADGQTLVEIGQQDGMPNRQTIHRWLAVYPKFFDAYERSREVSAQSFEEEALLMARILKNSNDFTGTKVQAYNIAMQQLRWSASRRDKTRYGQQQNGVSVVPIQINTTLNLGQAGMGAATDNATSIYTVEATVGAVPMFEDGYEADNVERLDGKPRLIDLEPEGDEDEASAWGLPKDETEQLSEPKPKPVPVKRPKALPKGHKSPAAMAQTARIYSQKEQRRLDALKKDQE